MKKLILIIPVLLTLPSYADIASGASSATCDNSTIGATEGSTDLEANWNANSITVNWYNGNTKITTNTCSYDGAVTIPATPTKAGYTFNGWHVRTGCPEGTYTIESQCLTFEQALTACSAGTFFNGEECVACESYTNGVCYPSSCGDMLTEEMCQYAQSNYLDNDSSPVYLERNRRRQECLWTGGRCANYWGG